MKTKTHRSSSAKIFNNNCPKALEYMENNAPFDRDIFQAGIVAHAVAQKFGELKVNLEDFDKMTEIANAVVKICMTEGRAFDGIHEPPIKPDSAFLGKEIALDYFRGNGSLPNDGKYERGIGMTDKGAPCDYEAQECRWKAILDLTYPELIEDENYTVDAIVVRDYKSAFPTNAAELDTIQMRGQAVLTWLHNPGTQAIVQEVVNLQTWGTHRNIILLDDEGEALLNTWKTEILMLCGAMDVTREARPGAGCLNCWYSAACDDCLEQYSKHPKDEAVALATLEAQRKDLIKALKAHTAESAIEVHGGYVGFRKQTKRVASDNAAALLVEHFFMDDTDDHPMDRALLKSINLTGGNVNAFIKAFYPDKNDAAREDIEAECLIEKHESRFGVYKS